MVEKLRRCPAHEGGDCMKKSDRKEEKFRIEKDHGVRWRANQMNEADVGSAT
jgi:hypothetical protein